MKVTKCLPRDGIGMVEAAAAAADTTVADMTVADTTAVAPLLGTGACRAGAIDRIQRSGQ